MDAPQKREKRGLNLKCRKRWTKDHILLPYPTKQSLIQYNKYKDKVTKKVRIGQAKLVAWDNIKDNPPVGLKISPIAAIPHKSKQF